MKKANVWEIVNKEAGYIIKDIEKGEINTRKEYNDYISSIYNWEVSSAIDRFIDVYLGANNIYMPWDDEQQDKDE